MNKINFEKMFSQTVDIEPSEIKIIYIFIKAPIRCDMIIRVCEESNISYTNAPKAIKELNKIGEVFPAIIIELMNEKVCEIDFYVLPIGPACPKDSLEPLFYSNTLVKKINKQDLTLKEFTNTMRSGYELIVPTWSNDSQKIVKSISGGKCSRFLVNKQKISERNWEEISNSDTIEEDDGQVEDPFASIEVKIEPHQNITEISDTGNEKQSSSQKSDTSHDKQKTTDNPEPKKAADKTQTDSDSDDSDGDEDTNEPKVHQINSLSTGSKLKLPDFKETDNCEAWVDKCSFLMKMGGIKDTAKKVQLLCSHLPDPIQETVITELALLEKEAITVEEFTRSLNKACKKNDLQYETLLKKLKYNPDTHLNLRNFFYRIKQLVKQTIGDGCEKMVEKISFKEFLEKLPPRVQKSEFLLEYRKEKSKGVMDVVDKCAELYDNYKGGDYSEINQVSHFKKGNNPHKNGRKFSKPSLNSMDKKIKCHFCGILGHKKSECRKLKAQSNNKGKSEIICHNCGKRGHKSPECRLPKGFSQNRKDDSKGNRPNNNKFSKGPGKDIICNFCGIKGHKEATCFKKNNANRRGVPTYRRS
jgi:hypothetical protein